MKLKPANKRTSRSLSLALLCTLAFCFCTSSCYCNRQYAGSQWGGGHAVKVGVDLPYDYLSREYSERYRTDPSWIFYDAAPVGGGK